jgi:hypothetical protein
MQATHSAYSLQFERPVSSNIRCRASRVAPSPAGLHVRRISASEAAKLAAENAQKARLELLRRNAEAAERRARTRRQHAIAAMTAGAVLTVVAITGIVYVALTPSVEPAPLQARKTSSDRFAATRVGIIRYGEGSRRNRCRQVEFSNNGGDLSNETTVSCTDPKAAVEDPDEPGESTPASRLDGIRGGFAKR